MGFSCGAALMVRSFANPHLTLLSWVISCNLPACLQEFNIEKLHLLEAEKARVRKEFERRDGQIEVKKKIEYSKQLNASRIKAGIVFSAAETCGTV